MIAQPGDVIKVTVFKWAPHENNWADPPIWGIVETLKVDGTLDEVTWVCGGNADFVAERVEIYDSNLIIANWDGWEIVPADQWPDEVCVTLAKRGLMK
jgi:hypothetical protein